MVSTQVIDFDGNSPEDFRRVFEVQASECVKNSDAVASASVGERDSSVWRENEGEGQAK